VILVALLALTLALNIGTADYDWNFNEAEQEFKRALGSSPGDANVHLWYANFLVQDGRIDEAIAEFKTAQTLDP
jgi:Tfp pilus assembly protein PilF